MKLWKNYLENNKDKMITIDDFINQMITFFPWTQSETDEHTNKFGERLSTIVIEDIIMPNVIETIKKQEKQKTKCIFDYFEQVSIDADDNLRNIFSITVLEILGNDANILEIAKQYMGPKTAQYQKQADLDLGRIRG